MVKCQNEVESVLKIKIFRLILIQSELVFIYTEASLEKSRDTINLRFVGATRAFELLLAAPVVSKLLLLLILMLPSHV